MAVDFGAVAGGQNHRFAHRGQAAELSQRSRQLGATEYDFLTDFDRSSAVIDSYDDKWHSDKLKPPRLSGKAAAQATGGAQWIVDSG